MPSPRLLARAITTAALLSLLAGCAAGSGSSSKGGALHDGQAAATPTTGADTPARRALEKAQADERRTPDMAAAALPPPPGLDGAALSPIDLNSPEHERAVRSFESALSELSPPAAANAAAPDAAPPPGRRQAVRIYASGRIKRMAGDLQGASADLSSASTLDPASGEIWRELAETQLALGRRLAAASSFQQAIRCGIDEPRPYWYLGREALKSGRAKDAAPLLAQAHVVSGGRAEAGLELVLLGDLAESLEALGYLEASMTAMERALSLAESFPGTTYYRAEASDFFRRRSEFFTLLGDMNMRLGRYEDASAAYTAAVESAPLDPAALTARRVHALMKLGRPAAASAVLLDRIAASGRIDDRDLDLVRYIARTRATGVLLADAIAELSQQAKTPADAGRLTLARAAALPTADAREVLRERLKAAPWDTAALRHLLETHAPEDHAGRVGELCGRADADPLRLPETVDVYLSLPGSADAVLADLQSQSGVAAAITRAIVRSKLGFTQEAGRDAEELLKRSPRQEVIAISCELLVDAGLFDTAERATATLAGAASAPGQLAYARALTALQRYREALDVLNAALGAEAAPDHFAWAAALANRVSDLPQAESWLNRALGRDPADERALETLVTLYSSPSPLADNDKLARTIRAMRELTPSSRSLRWLAVQELLQRRLDQQAERSLLSLAEQNPTSSPVIDVLTGLWEKRIAEKDADTARVAEEWLRARIVAYPESPALRLGLARIQVAKDDGAGAERELASILDTRPWRQLASARERLIREKLNDAARADALRDARLSRTPRGPDEAFEFADVIALRGEYARAADVIEEGLPKGSLLSPEQQLRLSNMLAKATRLDSPNADGNVDDPAGVLRLLGVGAAHGARYAPILHRFRVALLARSGAADDALLDAIAYAARQQPELESSMCAWTGQELMAGADRRRSLPYFRRAFAASKPPSAEIYFLLVRATVLTGDGSDLQSILEDSGATDVRRELLTKLTDTTPPSSESGVRAEFYYVMGNLYSGNGDDASAERCYRAALGVDPTHGWSNNNLGYHLLESGGDINEAERLLLAAAKSLPNEPSVLDSLAWLRYHQGRLTDNGGDQLAQFGAITLLKGAIAMPKGQSNATILDHLGDALWRSGRHDEAIDAWKEALNASSQEAATAAAAQTRSAAATDRLKQENDAIRAKLAAAQAGVDPALPAQRALPDRPE